MQPGSQVVEPFQCSNGSCIDVAGEDFDPIAAVDALLGQGARAVQLKLA